MGVRKRRPGLDAGVICSKSATSPSAILEELEALAAAERQCCSFATWKVSLEEDHLVLQVTGDQALPANRR
jgi:hypothetical protein